MCTPCRVDTRSFAQTAAPLGVGHHTEGCADACASWLYTCQSAIVADVARLKHRIMSGWCIGNATRVPKPLSMSACTCGVTPNAMQAMHSEHRVLLRSTVQKVELLLCRVWAGGHAQAAMDMQARGCDGGMWTAATTPQMCRNVAQDGRSAEGQSSQVKLTSGANPNVSAPKKRNTGRSDSNTVCTIDCLASRVKK
jgi:hypothetical protein